MTSPFNTDIKPVTKTGPDVVVPALDLITAPPGTYELATIKIGSAGQVIEARSNQRIDSLAELTDVDASNPANNNALVYNSSTGKWEPSAVIGGSGLTHPQVMKRIHIGL